ncbi:MULTISPECIES: HTH domain-containing protein, partial [unclassified Microcoleus]
TSAEGLTIQQILELLRDGTRPQKPTKQKLDLDQLAGESVPIGFRSDRLCLIAGLALRQGLSYLDFKTLILRHPQGPGEKIKDRSPKQQDNYLKDVWNYVSSDRATLPRLKPGPADAGGVFKKRSFGETWTKHVLSCPDVQKSGKNLYAAILEIERLSKLNHGHSFHLSKRSLAEAIGCSDTAARNCITKLCELGHIQKVVNGSQKTASIYRLKVSQKVTTQPLEGGGGCTERVVTYCDKCSHDSLSGRNGLKRYWLILDPSEPLTAAELAPLAKRTRQSVYKGLAQLEALGLIAKKGKGYVRIEDEAAHLRAAQMRGSLGRGEHRKLIHALQREGWKLEKQRRIDARNNEAKRQKLKDQAKYQHGTSQAERNRTKSDHLQVQNRTAGHGVSRPLQV